MAITNTRIANIRRAAADVEDWPTVAICERALGVAAGDLRVWHPKMTPADAAEVQAMTREQAEAWCEATDQALRAAAAEVQAKIVASFAQSTPILDWFRRAKG